MLEMQHISGMIGRLSKYENFRYKGGLLRRQFSLKKHLLITNQDATPNFYTHQVLERSWQACFVKIGTFPDRQ
jgi:hypothetical protein